MPPPSDTAYRRLADDLRESLNLGSLSRGMRFPSLRQSMRRHGLSLATVTHAYRLLEREGFIEARPQSGYFVRRDLDRKLPSVSRPPKKACEVREISYHSVVDMARSPKNAPLGAALLDPELLPWKRLNRFLAQALRDHGPDCNDYDFTPGYPGLREQVARQLLDAGLHASPEEVILTTGCTEALHLALRALTNPGDTVALESPAYYGLLAMMREMGLRVLELPTDACKGLRLDAAEGLLDAREVKALVVCPTYQNPLGSCMDEGSKRDLLDLCLRRGIPIVEDDIYGDLTHGTTRPRALAACGPRDNVVFCSSFSKTLSPGSRAGFVLPGRWGDRILALKRTTSFASANLPALGLASYLESGAYPRHLAGLRPVLGAQMEAYRLRLLDLLPEGSRISRPEGGYLLWVELPPGADSMVLARRAREKCITIAPGPLFSARGGYQRFFRVNAGYPLTPRMETSLEELGRMAHVATKE